MGSLQSALHVNSSQCALFPRDPRKAYDPTVSIFARVPILRLLSVQGHHLSFT